MDTHDTRQDLLYADLCFNQWEEAEGNRHVKKQVEKVWIPSLVCNITLGKSFSFCTIRGLVNSF